MLILISVFLHTTLSATYISVKDSGFFLSADDFTFSLDYGKVSLRYKGLSYGDIGRRGLMKTLSDPHKYSDFDIDAMPFRKNEYRSGVVYSNELFSIFYTQHPRGGVGFSGSASGISFMFAFFSDGLSKMKAQEDSLKVIDKDVMYFGLKYENKFLSLFSILSFDEYLSVYSILGGGLTYKEYSVEIKVGNIAALDNRDDYEFLTIKANIDSDIVDSEWKVSFGNKPIYSYEYMNKKSEKSIDIRLGNIILASDYVSTFSRKGVLSIKRSIFINHRFIVFGYDSNKGLFSLVRYENLSISIQKDQVGISFDFKLANDGSILSLSISNKDPISISMVIEL